MNKVFDTIDEAIGDVFDGASIMIGGFGDAGLPTNLIVALHRKGTGNITVISNNAGRAANVYDLNLLFKANQVRKLVAAFPVPPGGPTAFAQRYLAGEVELELVPQGTLAERIRAGGAGIGAFYTRTGVGTVVAEGKEKMVIGGKEYLLELPLRADFAFIKAYKGDRMGNLIYRMTARNFNPIMATAANVTIAEIEELVQVGELDPEAIVTPGIFVDRVVVVPRLSPT